jgi:hypothetical protein
VTTVDHVADHNCYRRGCRRDECRDADRYHRKEAELRRLRGIPGRVPGAVVAHHLCTVLASGRTRLDIAEESGVSDRAIRYILNGQKTVARPNALALLAVHPLPEPARVNVIGTLRRIQALAAVGWPIIWAAQQSGHSRAYIFAILAGEKQTVSSDSANRIAALYRTHANRIGPSKGTRTVARRNGWHSVVAWNDNIDDPTAEPETAEPYKPLPAGRPDTLRMAEIEHLYLLGESTDAMAKKLGGSEKYIGDQLAEVIRRREARARLEQAMARIGRTAVEVAA